MTSQHAWCDVNNDGVENNYDDIFPPITIGAGAKYAAGSMPTVIDAMPSQTYSGEAVNLWAKVQSVFPVEDVWAVIIPPNYDPFSPDTETEELPIVKLADTNGDGIYEAGFSDFAANGDYQISIYAMNDLHEVSLPVTRTIKAGGFPGYSCLRF